MSRFLNPLVPRWIGVMIVIMAIIGFWNASVQTTGIGLIGVLVLFLIGLPIEYNDKPRNLANFLPTWMTEHIWSIGAALCVTSTIKMFF